MQTPTRGVVVARRNIKSTKTIERAFFKVVQVPEGAIPHDAFGDLDELFPVDTILPPRTLKSHLYKNEVILRSRISQPGQGVGIASKIRKNTRALLVTVDRVTTRAHMIYPGSQIDILTTIKRSESQDTITQFVAQNIEVIAVNGIFDVAEFKIAKRDKKKRKRNDVLTILVKGDQQLQEIIHATSTGRINVLLRNQNDDQEIVTQGVTSTQLIPDEESTQKSKRSGQRSTRRSLRRRARRARPQPPVNSSRRSSTTTIDL